MSEKESNSTRFIAIGATAMVLVLNTVALAPPVMADNMSSGKRIKVINVPMVWAGYDRDIAAKNGYEVRLDATGREYVVPIGAHADAPALEMAPVNSMSTTKALSTSKLSGVSNKTSEVRVAQGVTTGNCGSSSIILENNENVRGRYIVTAAWYRWTSPVVYINMRISVTGPRNYLNEYVFNYPILPKHTWSSGPKPGAYSTSATYTATLTGHTTSIYGGKCDSLNPNFIAALVTP